MIPTRSYVDSLSESEQFAYLGSLYGTEEEVAAASTTELDPETGTEYPARSRNLGCEGQAEQEANAGEITTSPTYSDAMRARYEDIQHRVEAGLRTVKLTEQWSSCMKRASYDHADHHDLWARGQAELQARAGDVLNADSSANNQSGTLTSEQRARLEAVFKDEVKIGLAEYACSNDMNEKGQAINAEIEEGYALEQEDELKSLAATLASGEGTGTGWSVGRQAQLAKPSARKSARGSRASMRRARLTQRLAVPQRAVELGVHVLARGLVADRMQHRLHGRPHALRRDGDGVRRVVGAAALPGGAGQVRCDRVLQHTMGIGGRQLNTSEAPCTPVRKERIPC